MPYRSCPICSLVMGEPDAQRDHRCPRCLVTDGTGIEMVPIERGADAPEATLTSAPGWREGRGGSA